MGKGKRIDDHVTMLRNGREKDIPLELVDYWEKAGIMNRVGWKYKDPDAAQAALEKWEAHRAALKARALANKGTVMADEGFAGAQKNVGPEEDAMEGLGEPIAAAMVPERATVTASPEVADQHVPGGIEIPGVEVRDTLEE